MELRHTTKERRAAWRFFLEHAGGVGRVDAGGRTAWEHGRNALELARAEELLEQACELEAATFELVDDDEMYELGDMDPDEARGLFESGAWVGPFGVVVEVGADAGASLWGVVVGPRGAEDPYVRVVRAELASELVDDLRQAIGDTRDELEGVA